MFNKNLFNKWSPWFFILNTKNEILWSLVWLFLRISLNAACWYNPRIGVGCWPAGSASRFLPSPGARCSSPTGETAGSRSTVTEHSDSQRIKRFENKHDQFTLQGGDFPLRWAEIIWVKVRWAMSGTDRNTCRFGISWLKYLMKQGGMYLRLKNILVFVRKKATHTWIGLKNTYLPPPTGWL